MSAFICQISEIDWRVSREIGIYGNREGTIKEEKPAYFTETKKGGEAIQSIIEDLIGMRKGDIIFFHVIKRGRERKKQKRRKNKKESSIHGIYRVKEEPFYNNQPIWESSPYFVFPYRFCFEPHSEHAELCKYDANIPVSEFYRSVENRDIASILTLEREVRGGAHAVKKILCEDAEEIIKLLYRSFHIHRLHNPVAFKPRKMQMTPLRRLIQKVGKIEFAVKAVVAYELGRRTSRVTKFIPACKNEYDFIIEAFIGQTIRKGVDLLCTASKDSKSKIVTIIEVKTHRSKIDDLIQALKYQEIFKLRNIDKGSLSYKYSICLLAQRFQQELVEYASIRNTILPWEEMILLKYTPTDDGKDANFTLQGLPEKVVSPLLETYPKIAIHDPFSRVSSDADNYYTVFNRKVLPNVTLELQSQSENLIVLERKYGDNRLSLGRIMIYQIPGKCHLKDFIEFMKRIHEEVIKSQGDTMSIEPIIIAKDYESPIGLFIEKYNKYETLAQRQPISAYVL